MQLLDDMQQLAGLGVASIAAKGFVNGEHRRYAYTGGAMFQPDRAAETTTMTMLRCCGRLRWADATGGAVITVTVAPPRKCHPHRHRSR